MSNRNTEPETGGLDTVYAAGVNDWRTAVSTLFVPLQVRSSSPDRLHGRIRAKTLAQVTVAEVSATEQVAQRITPLEGERATGRYMLCLQLEGTGIVVQDNREAVLSPGDISLYDMDRPYSLVFEENFNCLAVMFPRELFFAPPSIVAEVMAHRIARDDGLARVVSPLLAGLADNLELLSGQHGSRLVHNAVDMVSTVLLGHLDSAGARSEDPRTVNPRAEILNYIENNLGSTDLSPSSIAKAHFISTRHLYHLFENQDMTIGEWIRFRRLEKCRRDLTNPVYDGESIATIAARAGFTNPSHFSQCFRRSYGLSARDLRAQRADGGRLTS